MKQETHDLDGPNSKSKEYHTIATYRTTHTIKPPTRYDGFKDLISYTLFTSNGDPTTWFA